MMVMNEVRETVMEDSRVAKGVESVIMQIGFGNHFIIYLKLFSKIVSKDG